MHQVTNVQVMTDFKLHLTFDTGESGVVDLSGLAGKGVFALWLERGAFEKVRIGASGELVWGNEIDLCPDALYLKVTGKTAEDVFGALRRDPAHA
jgi:hypothetical protein